jgi:ABC-type nitrate/sulfonate/bicarbonate transport system substrate-binding protein
VVELTLAGTAGLLATRPRDAAEELLRAEGVTDVQYPTFPEGASGVTGRLGSGAIDITQWYKDVRFVEHSMADSVHYFCCTVVANKEFVRKHPVATKRAGRAILKADQPCALEPERVGRSIVDRGFTKSYDCAFQAMKDVPDGRWRQYEAEDTVRFYALRLHEAGVIKSNPAKIIAQGTDWRFINELKKELKG